MWFGSSQFEIFFIVTCAILGAGIIFATVYAYLDRPDATIKKHLREAGTAAVFLFDDVDLLDATPSAQQIFRKSAQDVSDWDSFVAQFSGHFPTLRQELAVLAQSGQVVLTSGLNPLVTLEAEFRDGLARLSLIDQQDTLSSAKTQSVAALETELSLLRSVAEDSPAPMWRQDSSGAITWANKTYLILVDAVFPKSEKEFRKWPPEALFPNLPSLAEHSGALKTRVALESTLQTRPNWYDVTSLRRDDELVCFAVDCSAIVRAESTQKKFVQTLSKTFADLSVGLAVFDQKRRLMIFNPALTELTDLPIGFLSMQPTIHAVLDRLRDMNMLPEPKNYKSWREEISALEVAAKDGRYLESWDLPNGRTFRVTARPHPDGALALLFEDISAEVTLTRRFRSELEMSQFTIDSLDDALATFHSSGTMTTWNAAYAELWNLENRTSLSDSNIGQESMAWQLSCAPATVWTDIRKFVGGFGDRQKWEDQITLSDGRPLQVFVTPLPLGSTLVRFRIEAGSLQDVTPAPMIRRA